jgi:hypothetical protein
MVGKRPASIEHYELGRVQDGVPMGVLMDIATITGCRIVVELYPDAWELKEKLETDCEVGFPDPFTRFADQRMTLRECCRKCGQPWSKNHKCLHHPKRGVKKKFRSSLRS